MSISNAEFREGVLNSVLYGGDAPLGTIPYPSIYHFDFDLKQEPT